MGPSLSNLPVMGKTKSELGLDPLKYQGSPGWALPALAVSSAPNLPSGLTSKPDLWVRCVVAARQVPGKWACTACPWHGFSPWDGSNSIFWTNQCWCELPKPLPQGGAAGCQVPQPCMPQSLAGLSMQLCLRPVAPVSGGPPSSWFLARAQREAHARGWCFCGHPGTSRWSEMRSITLLSLHPGPSASMTAVPVTFGMECGLEAAVSILLVPMLSSCWHQLLVAHRHTPA